MKNILYCVIWFESLKSPGNLIAIALDAITDKNVWNHEIRIKVK